MTAAHGHALAIALLLSLPALAGACRGAGEGSPQVATASGSAARGCAENATDVAPVPARRVVALLPAVSEMVVALGAADRLVARTDHDAHRALAGLPSVGGGLTPSLERLALLRPDLIVTWPDNASRSLARQLRGIGAEALPAATETVEDVLHTICEVGRRLGRTAAADSLVRALRSELAAVRRAVAGKPRPGVLYVVWPDPPTTAGPGSFIDELIGVAGGRNAFADARGFWPQVSLEEILRRRPDVVVLPNEAGEAAPERLTRAHGWRELEAIREGRLVVVDRDLFHHPGPGLGEAARRLASGLHPEVAPILAEP